METPRDLLERLRLSVAQGQRHKVVRPPKELWDFLSSLGYKPEDLDNITRRLRDTDLDWGQELLNMHLKRLPNEFERFFRDEELFAVGILDISEVNAQAILAPNGGWLVVINNGLIIFLYKVARALCTRFVARDSQGNNPFGESIPEFEETCRWIEEVFAWYAGARIPFGPDFPIHPTQIMMANLLATKAEQFVLCHELAHHILGHLNTARSKSILVNNVAVEAPILGWDQEFEADCVGLRLLLGKENPQHNEDTVMGYTGADFFLQTMSLFEELAEIPDSETHPPSSTRLGQLRDYAASICTDDASQRALFQRTEVIEQLFTQVRKTLTKPSPQNIEKALQRANRIVSKLQNVLDECVGGMVPNYTRFYLEIDQMLNEGAPDALCSAIASTMDQLEQHLESLNQREPTNQDQVAFRKLKLLLGFLSHLEPEMRAAIESMRSQEMLEQEPRDARGEADEQN